MTRARLLTSWAVIFLGALVLVSCSSDRKAAAGGDPARGKQLFASRGCAGCHTFKAGGSKGTAGASATG